MKIFGSSLYVLLFIDETRNFSNTLNHSCARRKTEQKCLFWVAIYKNYKHREKSEQLKRGKNYDYKNLVKIGTKNTAKVLDRSESILHLPFLLHQKSVFGKKFFSINKSVCRERVCNTIQ